MSDAVKKLAEAKGLDMVVDVTNAVYFNVPWQVRFTKELTKDQPFMVSAGMQKTVPLMFKQTQMRYAKKDGFQMAALPCGQLAHNHGGVAWI